MAAYHPSRGLPSGPGFGRRPWIGWLALGVLLLGSCGCSVRWVDAAGRARDAGLVLVRTQDFEHGRVRTVFAPGLRVVLAGADAGFGLGLGLWTETIPELREPLVRTGADLQRLLAEWEREATRAPSDLPPEAPRWDALWHVAQEDEGPVAILELHQLGLYLRTPASHRRVGAGWSSLRALTGPVLQDDVVLMDGRHAPDHPNRSLILWRPRWAAPPEPEHPSPRP